MNKAFALARAELIRCLSAYSGVATDNGAADGSTIIDSALIGKNDFLTGKTALIITGDAALEDAGILSFDSTTGAITLAGAGFSAQIVEGTIFRVLNFGDISSLIDSLISYEGVTTSDGAFDGSTLVCLPLASLADFDGNQVVIESGDYAGQARDIDGATNNVTGTVTPHLAFGGRIVEGTRFQILALRMVPAEVAAIEGKLDNATWGLAALKALIDAVEGKLDDGTSGLAALKALLDSILEDTGTTLEDKLDAISGAMALEATLGTHDTDIKALLATIAGYIDTEVAAIEAKLDVQKGATGVFYEQASVAINESVDNTEHFVVALTAANTRYILRSLRLKSADPGAGNTITVKLYGYILNVSTEIDSFVITQANFGTYFSLMDMFGVPDIAADYIRITLTGALAGPVVVTGQYSFGKTNV